jgi:hypothetical protein
MLSREIDVALVGLYLRGFGVLPWRGWRNITNLFWRNVPSIADMPSLLREHGFREAAMVLEIPGHLDAAWDLIEDQRALSPANPLFPARWRQSKFCPPAVWAKNLSHLPPDGTLSLAVVGSRFPPERCLSFVSEVVRQLESSEAGTAWHVVSGGAEGCDVAAERASGFPVSILPFGLNFARTDFACFSVVAPSEPFGTMNAMERNALIFAFGARAIVGHCELGSGGAWHGAVGALRAGETPVGVYTGEFVGEGLCGDRSANFPGAVFPASVFPGAKGLMSARAVPLRGVAEAVRWVQSEVPMRQLFEVDEVRLASVG